MYQFLPTVIGAALLAIAMPSAAQAPAKPAEKKASTASAKPTASKPAGQKAANATKPGLSRSAQKAVEEVTPVDDDPTVTLTEAELEIAKQVYVGEMPCELGASVHVRPARRTGFFMVTTKGHRFLMHPHESRTGAIRLEDPRRGALWLQLGNKSMLMSQTLGRRLADECQSPQQVTYAEELKRNPRPSILEPMPMHQGGMHQGGMHRGGMTQPPVQGEPTQPPGLASPPPAAGAAPAAEAAPAIPAPAAQ